MQTDVKEILTAFVDGEAVEPTELAEVLTEPSAREALLDFMLLRAVLVDETVPSSGFVERMRARLGGPGPATRARRSLRVAAAAAVLALAALGVLDLGRMLRPEQPDQPPEPTRVIRFEPGVDWGPANGR